MSSKRVWPEGFFGKPAKKVAPSTSAHHASAHHASAHPASATYSAPQLQWNAEQQRVRQLVVKGSNVCVTGPGGTGKSALIRQLVEDLAKAHRKVQVCAMTGCAAVLLNCRAKTLHSGTGIGLAQGTYDEVVLRVASSAYKAKHWQSLQVLIVDEVSMMSKRLFDILNIVGQKTRHNMQPFGNVQLVFFGDFYQLPPVGATPEETAFCFESADWQRVFPPQQTVILHQLYRQTDPVYGKLLNEIRIGQLSPASIEILEQRLHAKRDAGAIQPTILLPRRKDVEQLNQAEMDKLPGEIHFYLMQNIVLPTPAPPAHSASAKKPPTQPSQAQIDMEHKILRDNLLADPLVMLKEGAQVMCIANIDVDSEHPIVNGSQGVVVRFEQEQPVVRFTNGSESVITPHTWLSETMPTIGVKQLPLLPAWAITIHKAQGVSLDMAQIDVGRGIFEAGQTYVALSRVRSLEGLYLTALEPAKIRVEPKVQAFYEQLQTDPQ